MSVAAGTVADLILCQNGTPDIMVGYKARLAIKVAKEQIAAGVTSLSQQPAIYQACIARAIVNESNR